MRNFLAAGFRQLLIREAKNPPIVAPDRPAPTLWDGAPHPWLTDEPEFRTCIRSEEADAWRQACEAIEARPYRPDVDYPEAPLAHTYRTTGGGWVRLCDELEIGPRLSSPMGGWRVESCPTCQARQGELMTAWEDARAQWAE